MGIDVKLTGVSDFDQLEIVKTGVVHFVYDTSSYFTQSVPHNLGYVPIPYCFLGNAQLNGSGEYNIPLPIFSAASVDTGAHVVTFNGWLFCSTDSTNLYIQLLNSLAAGGSFTVSYYLMRKRSST
jgi:hydroxymethylglutaryl-CoA reductase